MPSQPITEKERALILAAARRGDKYTDIAQAFGVSRATAINIAKAGGVMPRRRGPRSKTVVGA